MFEIVILLFLIFLNGLFVMAEIALVSARKSRLEQLADKGDDKAKAALRLAENPELFLSTAQIFITLVAILVGFYSGEKFAADLQPYLERIPLIYHFRRAYTQAHRSSSCRTDRKARSQAGEDPFPYHPSHRLAVEHQQQPVL